VERVGRHSRSSTSDDGCRQANARWARRGSMAATKLLGDVVLLNGGYSPAKASAHALDRRLSFTFSNQPPNEQLDSGPEVVLGSSAPSSNGLLAAFAGAGARSSQSVTIRQSMSTASLRSKGSPVMIIGERVSQRIWAGRPSCGQHAALPVTWTSCVGGVVLLECRLRQVFCEGLLNVFPAGVQAWLEEPPLGRPRCATRSCSASTTTQRCQC
jgi:hypothetical protein